MRSLGLLVACLMLAACGSAPSGQGRDDLVGDKDSDSKDAGKSDAGKKTDAGKSDGGKSDANGGKTDANIPKTGELQIPKAPCEVLQRNGCLTCHQTPVENGAPMPLFSVEHFTAKNADGASYGEQVVARISDTQRPMPPQYTGRPMLTADDVTTLNDWVQGGMVGEEGDACDPSVVPTGAVGPTKPPEWATQPWPEDECEVVFTLGAHGDLNPINANSSAYDISSAKTDYHCFYEQVPWGDKEMHAIALRVNRDSADDQEFVHHLVVSVNSATDASLAGAKPNFNGDHKHCDNPTGSTLAVWAPGSQNPISTPTDVGILLPTGQSYFELQVHYNNPSGKTGRKSKVRYDICATSKKRANVAGTFWLGYENANFQTISGLEALLPLDIKGNGKARGSCEVKKRGRILSIMPHMHELGKHATVEIWRKSGSKQTILDAPFNFEDQYSQFYDDLWVDPGDKVITTCLWSKSPVNFGFASDQEMCFFYTLGYGLDMLAPGIGERGIVGGNLACAGAIGPD